MTAAGAFARTVRLPNAARGPLTLAVLLAAYAGSLVAMLPKYFSPWIPVHRDTFDHASYGYYSWPIVLASPRPAAWIVMKLANPLGIYGQTAVAIALSLGGIFLLVLTVRELLNISWPDFYASLPIYALALFCSPAFYVKHRDDFEVDTTLFFLAAAFYLFSRWRRTGHVLSLLGALASVVAFAFAKETFWLGAPILALGFAVARRFDRQWLAFALWIVIVVAAAYLVLGHRSVYLNSANSAYHISLEPSSIATLLERYLALALTVPSGLLCALGIWNARRDRSKAYALVAFLAAGVAAYLPNSLLPNHFLSWYAWDGLPVLLMPLIAAVALPRNVDDGSPAHA